MNGKLLGNRYELIEKVGSGGMANVYKAKCHLLNRFVAVKILRAEYITDKDFLEKFRKESRSAASLSHQNIVNIYDVGMEDNVPYIVMEYIAGVTLKEYIDNYDGFLTNEQIADFSKQIALALEHAHSNQIIHRDIKPHNIMVTKDGVLKVADFGIASAISETTTSFSSEAIGSVRYTSPEQARGRNVDERTDLYSLGVLMYEMATRSVPFEGETAVEIALKHMKDDVVNPTSINRCFNKGLESIIMRSLLKDLGQRYQSARDLIDDLNKIIRNPNENVPFYTFDTYSPTQKIPSLEEYDEMDNNIENRTIKMRNENKPVKKPINGAAKKNSKKNDKNIVAVISVVALAFLTVLTVFVLLRLQPFLLDKMSDEISLISVVDMNYEKAKLLLENEGFKVVDGVPESNNYIEAGNISSQSPVADTKLRAGYKITLNVSKGAVKELIPNLVHKQLKEAELIIEQSSFSLGEVTYVNDDIDKGYVIEQSPAAKVEANDNSVIDLVVSLGKESTVVIMPSLSNKTIEEVQKELILIDINLDNIEYEYNSTVSKDLVISQSVSRGAEINPGASVDIVISMGVENSDTSETDTTTPDTTTPVDENAVGKKIYSLPLSAYVNQTVTIKVIYEKVDSSLIVYNESHEITEEDSTQKIKVKGSGSGTLYFYINDEILNSLAVDFSE